MRSSLFLALRIMIMAAAMSAVGLARSTGADGPEIASVLPTTVIAPPAVAPPPSLDPGPNPNLDNDGTVNFAVLDADPTGNTSSHMGDNHVAGLPNTETCVNVTPGSTFGIDVLVDAIPSYESMASLVPAPTPPGVNALQFLLRYDDTRLTRAVPNASDTILNAGASPEDDGVLKAANTVVTSPRTDAIGLVDTSDGEGGFGEASVAGVVFRQPFSVSLNASGLTQIELLASTGDIFSTVNAGAGTAQRSLDIDNLYGLDNTAGTADDLPPSPATRTAILAAIAPAVCPPLMADSDADGVGDATDECAGTLGAANVDDDGCSATQAEPAALDRATSDRPDDPDKAGQYQVHYVYMVPAAGEDRGYDWHADFIPRSISAQSSWLSGKTGGRAYRVDTAGGGDAWDITFVQAFRTQAQFDAGGVLATISTELSEHNLTASKKRYSVYFDGSGPLDICGQAPAPGSHNAIYLRPRVTPQTPPVSCNENNWATSPTAPQWVEDTVLHETTHNEGIVGVGAPNRNGGSTCPNLPSTAHVCDDCPAGSDGGLPSRTVDFQDLSAVAPKLFQSSAAPGNHRFDLLPSAAVDIQDLNAQIPSLFISCQPP